MTVRAWIAFLALCLLAGSELTLSTVLPHPVPGLLGEALRLIVVGLVFLVISRHEPSSSPRRLMQVGGWGAVFLTLLPITFAAAGSRVAGLTELLVSTSVPAAVVFLMAQRESGFGQSSSSFALMVPALAGLAGEALLISYTLPGTLSGGLWLAAMALACVATGYAAMELHWLLAEGRLLQSCAAICLGGALACGLCSGIGWTPLTAVDGQAVTVELARVLFLEGPALLLTFWLIAQMTPAAFSVRFLLVPLVAIAEAFAIARPATDWTMYAGTALVLGASWVLLRSTPDPV